MSRSEDFVKNFEAGVMAITENVPEDLRWWVFVYCRDAADPLEHGPEWNINYALQSNTLLFDRLTMRQALDESLNQTVLWD